MLFDTHAHIFPEAIAEKATESVGKFYGYPMSCIGSVDCLLREGATIGTTRYLVHSVATTSRQTVKINNFIAEQVAQHPGMFTGFMAMHQDTPDMQGEVERALGMGLKGVKIHPDIQHIAIDSEKFYPLFEAIEGRVPLLTHAGDSRYAFSNPYLILNVLKRYPKMTVICAHLGGHSEWDEAVSMLAGTGVYIDTSSSLAFMTPERAASIIRAFGVEKTFFGTDFPMWTSLGEKERFDALPLTDEEKEMILWKNAYTFFGA